ncbi:hypothetical protein OG912_25125 [Streptomyces sp. NBC_00464]|uniref:hypothetical protein n=1 Tax=Streptomyces sp. NBC_00464 TaxID=2975751 RepID=UPI002E1703D1
MIFSKNPDPVSAPAPAPAPASSSPRSEPSARSSPDHASAETESPSATPEASASPSASSTSDADLAAPAGYEAATKTMWGLAPAPCNQKEQQLVDLDDGSSRVEPAGNGAAKDPRGAELLYWPVTCWDQDNYQVRALPNTRVGLLQADMPKSFESCKAASRTGFGALGLFNSYDRRKRGFVEGAALCSVTDKGAVSMALIDHIDDGSDEASVSGTLYVWPKSS